MYDFDSNTSNAVAIKNRKKDSLIKGYNEMHEYSYIKLESIQYYID
jgi:hypothetical protein